jgi:phage-related baseplate assembly protein
MSIIPVLLKDLVTRITFEQNLTTVLETFRTAEFAVDSWRPGGGYHTLASFLAKGLTAGTDVVQAIAKGGHLDLATGNWLTLLARSWFRLTRRPASYAYFTVRLSLAAGAAPYPAVAGAVWVETAAHKRFNCTTGGIVPSGSSLDLTFKAESPGSSYNVTPADINLMITAVPGMTCLGITLTIPGLNAESDTELRTRCRLRWATLAAQAVGGTYQFWALTEDDGTTARAQVTRAYVDIDNPEGPGTVHVYLAGPAGAVDPAVVTEVDDDLQERKGPSTDLLTSSASALTIAPTGTAWVSGTTTTAAIAEAEALFAEMLLAIPIGGHNIGGSRGVFRDEIEATIRQATGVVRVSLTSGDHTMTATQVAVPAATLPLGGISFLAA